MPISYSVDGDIVVVVATGIVRNREQADFIRALRSDPAVPRPFKILGDCRKQTGPISTKSAKRFSSQVLPDTLTAIVANDDLIYGMSRVFRGHAKMPDNVKVFRGIADAREWLAKPDN